jgi:hypothetical protein
VKAAAAAVLAGVLAVVGGCAPAPTAAPPAPSTAPAASGPPPSVLAEGGGAGRHGGRGERAAAVLPADFPPDVPLPPGSLQAATGAAGRWSALLVVSGSAAQAAESAMRFYLAHGFTADSSSTAHRDRYTVTVVTENRDHSDSSTNLVVGVAAR